MKAPLFFLSALGLSASAGNAALIAAYNIDGTTYAAASTPSNVNPAVSAGSIISATAGGGPGNFSVSNSSNTAFLQYSQSASTLAGAITEADYLQFALTVPAGSTLSLSSLDAVFRTDAAGTSSSLSLLVSTDGFVTPAAAGNAVGTINTTSSTASTGGFDLSAPAYQNLSGTTLTFRIYGFDNSSTAGSYLRLESFTINGTAIPEPTSLAVGLAMIPFALLRRRR